jgi:hypothetical protein
MLETPVLFIIYNRPDVTEKVFDKIKKIRPSRLYVVADGPKNQADWKACKETRDVISVNWKCELHTLFREENWGCKRSVSNGISWAFEQEEKLIILEVDTLPNLSFFKFCDDLLKIYKSNNQVFSITGVNWQNGKWRGSGSYYFSHYPGIWGWATWKNRWEKFDSVLSDLYQQINKGFLDHLTNCDDEKEFHLCNLINTKSGKIDSWGFAWHFTFYKYKAFCIVPNCNLISNIGFDHRATHTKQNDSWKANQPGKEMIFPLIDPNKVERNLKADKYMARRNFLHNFSFSDKIKFKFRDWIKHS